jgi:hypothetical protein
MTPPKADYLRRLIFAVMADDVAPLAVRNECHHLILAIELNNLECVTDCLKQLQDAAKTEGFELPVAESQSDRKG